jgi:cysteinyl-tRNA synthetase
LNSINDLLGVVRSEYGMTAAKPEADGLASQVEALLAQRADARVRRDWPRADALRAELDALGVEVMDTPEGPRWRRKV